MKIAILGGSFNPPHNGHLIIAEQVRDYLELDEIWIMPCFSHPFNKDLLDPKKRFEMVKYLGSNHIKVSDFEIKKNQVCYTIETLDYLKNKYPHNIFYWIIGADQLESFKKWRKWEELAKKHKLVIFPRESKRDLETMVEKIFDKEGLRGNVIPFLYENIVTTNIASSMIRQKIREGRSIKYLVPEKIERYIIKNELYK